MESNRKTNIEAIVEEAANNGANSDEIENIRNEEINRTDKVTNREDGTWTHVANRIRRYKTIVNVKDLTGTSIGQKLKTVQNAVNDIDEFMGTRLHFYGKEQFIMAEFGKKDNAEQACAKCLESDNEARLNILRNKGDTEVRNRMMIVRDLPLNFDKNTLKTLLEKKGNGTIEEITTRVMGNWMTAQILFDDGKVIDNLKDTWSIEYQKEWCRMAPATANRNDIEERNRFSLKLANLPFGITAYDLKEFLRNAEAQTCFFPRSRDKYTRARYAYVSFKTEEQMIKLVESKDKIAIKNNHVYWLLPDDKTCHKCGSGEHLVVNCSEKEQSEERKNRMWQYRKVYERYRVPNYKKIMNFNREENHGQSSNQQTYNNRNNENIENNRNSRDYTKEQGRGNFDKEATTTYELFKQIKEEMSFLREELGKVNERITRLENDKQEPSTSNQVTCNKTNEKGKNLDFQIRNPYNNNNVQNSYERARRNTTRFFDQQNNNNGKRVPVGSGENTSDSDNNASTNLIKQRKITGSNQVNVDNQEKNEIKQLRDMLTNSNERSLNLENKLNTALEMLAKQFNQQPNNNVNNES